MVLSHINRFSGTEWCFRWVLFRKNVLGGTNWNAGEDAWRGDGRRGVGLYVNMWDMEKGWLASLWTCQSPFLLGITLGL